MIQAYLSSRADASVERSRPAAPDFSVGGTFLIQCIGPDGEVRWSERAKNGVTDAGINDLLDVYFRAQTAPANWYLGLIDNAGYTALAAGDTMASHPGWAENQSFSNANRPGWTAAAASGKSIGNTTTVDFNINGDATIRGVFITTTNDKGGSTGKLFATAPFSGGNQVVTNGDTLKVTYSVTGASG